MCNKCILSDKCLNSRNTKIKEIEKNFLNNLYYEKGEDFYHRYDDKAKERQVSAEIENFTNMLKEKLSIEDYEKAFTMFNKILVDKSELYNDFNQYCYTEGVKDGIKLF